MERDLLDADGQNRAVRCFLRAYSCDRSMSVAEMCQHMSRTGWHGAWPAWASEANGSDLTKGSAQDWLRHLFKMETDSA